ncbi:hypothetical protein [Paenibacillus beijingensis]|uniref:hypothetical protein n=1 Tax=Paenibacillus beijingensis TaxID=1126833 RepID=UPI0011DC874A|nr:hypothetical protein [Paenibacillus beijingensis]
MRRLPRAKLWFGYRPSQVERQLNALQSEREQVEQQMEDERRKAEALIAAKRLYNAELQQQLNELLAAERAGNSRRLS